MLAAYNDPAVFLDRHSPARDHKFTERLLSDYKEQKAFSYFASNFIMELMYHPITGIIAFDLSLIKIMY